MAASLSASAYPASAELVDTEYVYMDCDILAEKEEVNSISSSVLKKSFRFNHSLNVIEEYNGEYNKYVTLCNFYKCEVGDEKIRWHHSNGREDSKTWWETTISRWDGSYRGYSRINEGGKSPLSVNLRGTCKAGISLIRSTPKF